ncbi:MAG: hypothetical protein ICV87_00235 [Gemmatimonadetes bacterium]|nr:hypothetical protein [Gemmatimonadota bacterium]
MSENKPLDVNDPDHVDEVMEELWRIREELWAEFNGDMQAMGRYLKERERLHPERMVGYEGQDAAPKETATEPEAA